MKKVLAVYYSQTGQLSSVIKSICAPLESTPGIEVSYECLQPVEPYPFPWSFFQFLDVFPESVYLDPPRLKPLSSTADGEYDLILVAYQVWFLSPALPITAFLQSEQGKRLLKDKPVITVIACRNMWLMAQEKMKQLISAAQGRLLDNIALVDSGSSLLTFITTPRWLLSGNKGRSDGWLPVAGVSEEEIHASARFGRALVPALQQGLERGDGPLLEGLRAVSVDTRLIPSEKIGTRSFMIWGKLLRRVGNSGSAARKPVLFIYVVFLISLIISVVPLTMLLRTLLRPLMRRRLARQKEYFEQPSGSAETRLAEFSHD
jgi:hypothetical protein